MAPFLLVVNVFSKRGFVVTKVATKTNNWQLLLT